MKFNEIVHPVLLVLVPNQVKILLAVLLQKLSK